MTKLEKIQLFLDFWFSPWGAVKGEIWESFSGDRPFTDNAAIEILKLIVNTDHSFNWRELESYKPRKPLTNEQFALLLADAFDQFGKIPEGKDMPGNAITLWRAMIHGWDRVVQRLRSYREI